MRTVETTVYKFEELPEATKALVVEKNHDYNLYEGWYNDTFEYWNEKLKSIGFEDTEIAFSGFWSQGDGASFTAYVDFLNILPTYIDYALTPGSKEARRLMALTECGYLDGRFSIDRHGHHYSHEYTVSANAECFLDCLTDIEIDTILENLTEIARIYMRQIYADLEREYEYRTSRAAIEEGLIVNEYEFTTDGEIY